jgi:hypothetical protein
MTLTKYFARRLTGSLTMGMLGIQLHHFCPTATAYPPGPYHLLYGTVRDQFGTPVTRDTAQVVLQTPTGVQFSTPIIPAASLPGVNYLLKIPLDSGATPDLYSPHVLVTGSYKLVVVIDVVTNVPIEMATNYAVVGEWAKSTRIDLTLGIDANGDGLPDAWENAFLAMLGTNMPLSSLTANSVLTPDGLTLRQEYLLGTALFDPGNPLEITFLGFNGTSPVLQFPTITGRSYTVLGSPDLENWSPVAFNLASDVSDAPAYASYLAPAVGPVQVYLVPPPPGTSRQFYRIQVQ